MVDSGARRKEIKRRLREIARDPSAAGATAEAQRLAGEYKRLASADRTPAAEQSVAPVPGLSEQDAAAVATWPAELRARLQGASMSRIIAPWGRG